MLFDRVYLYFDFLLKYSLVNLYRTHPLEIHSFQINIGTYSIKIKLERTDNHITYYSDTHTVFKYTSRL